MTASLTGDTTAEKTGTNYTIKYDSAKKEYSAEVTLTQGQEGWQTTVDKIGGVAPTGTPTSGGSITITLADGVNAPTIVCK